VIEFVREGVERRHQGSRNLFYEGPETGKRQRETRDPLELDRELVELLGRAYKSQAEQRGVLAGALFTTAGNRALRLFDITAQGNSSPYEQLQRASYGELAIIALLEAGGITQASVFGQRFVQDLLVPEDPKERVRRMIQPDWKAITRTKIPLK
jgi:hypothetical protein